MVIGRAARRTERKPLFDEAFGADAEAALDLMDLLELAWHDCYREVTFPKKVQEDLLLVAGGDLPTLVRAALLAVEDFRDLRLWADKQRKNLPPEPGLKGALRRITKRTI